MNHLPKKSLTMVTVLSLLAMAFTLAPGSAMAADSYNWTWQNPLPQGNDLNAVTAADAAHAWSVGGAGTIMFFNGAVWTHQANPTTNDLNDVAAANTTHVWAVGSAGTVLFYNGTSWSSQSSGTSNTLNGITVVDATHVWAVGAGGTVLFFNGTSWATQTSGTSQALLSVSASDSSHVWAVGFSGAVVYYNGANWTTQSSGISDGWITGVSAVDSTHIWAEGYRQVSHALSYFILFYNGSSWTTQLTGDDYWLTDLSALDATHVWAVGSTGTVLFYNGTSWAKQASPADKTLYSVYALDSTHVWATGTAGVLLFYGGAWSKQSQGATFDISSISAPDQNHAWAVGASGNILAYTGDDWVEQDSGTAGPYYGVRALDADHVWAVGGNGRISFWNGSTWSQQVSGTTNALFSVTALDAHHVWAVGTNGAVRFFNGTSWAGQASGTTEWLTGVSAADANHVWAVGTGKSILFYNGSMWKNADTSATNGLNSVSALDATHVWAVGPAGVVLFISGELNWTTQDSGTTLGLNAVSAVASDHVLAAGESGVIRYYDGKTWTALSSGCLHDIEGVTTPDGGHVWIAGDDGSIMLGQVITQATSRTWGTDSIGVSTPSTTWYLAEGCTGPGFETWVLIQNPGASAATVNLDYMTGSGKVTGPEVTVPARSRASVNVAGTVPGMWDVSTKVTSNQPVVVERAMYGSNRTWGHDSIGATTPSLNWYLAEGSTGTGFETWVLVQNPNPAATSVTLTYMLSSGAVRTRNVSIPANSRKSYNVADTVPGEWSVSTKVHSNNSARPVIAERAMYGGSRTWGHDSIGVTAGARHWYLAEGCTGNSFETWILVQNPGDGTADITLTYMTPEGTVAGTTETLPAHSRKTYNVADVAPNAWEVSTKVDSNRPVIAERAMYGNNRTWAHDSIGASGAFTDWYLAEGCTGSGFETWILVQNPQTSTALVQLNYMTAAGKVAGPKVQIRAQSRMTFNIGQTVPGTWDVSTQVTSSVPVVAERAIYGDAK